MSLKQDHGISLTYDNVKLSFFDNWPDISIRFEDLFVVNENENPKKTPVLRAGALSLALNMKKLIHGEFVISEIMMKNGEVLLEKDINDKTNFKIKRDTISTDTINLAFLQIKKVHFNNVAFNFYNRKKAKHIGMLFEKTKVKLEWFGKSVTAKTDGTVKIDELLFKPKKGALFKNKRADIHLDIMYLANRKSMFIVNGSEANIENQKYDLFGLVAFDTVPRIALNIRADIKNFQKTISLLNAKIQKNLSKVSVENVIQTEAIIISKFNKEEDPYIDVKFTGNKNNITLGDIKVPYTNVSFNGRLLCLPDSNGDRGMENAVVKIGNIKGLVYDVPFKANVSIRNFIEPYMQSDASMDIKGSDIKFKAGKDFDLRGMCRAIIKYEGPTAGLSKETFLNAPMRLNAEVNFEKFTYKTKKNKLPFTINGNAFVMNDSLKFKNLSLATAGGNFTIRGKAIGFTSYACNLNDGFKADIVAGSSFFDITPLLQNTEQKKPAHGKKTISKIRQSDFEFTMQMDIRKLMIRKLEGTNVTASLHYKDELITLRKLHFNSCNGSLSATGTLDDYSKGKANIILENMDVRTLFEQCENFKQKALLSENVLGTLSATTDVEVDFNEQFALDASSMKADVNAVLEDGHLINFEPLQKISSFVFKSRNFADVNFTEMNPIFTIRNKEMKIETFEIASNVMNLFVSGTYHFTDMSNINLILPWSNLKYRGSDYIPKKLAKDGETTKGLKLNVYGYPDKMKVRLGHR